MFFTFNQNNSGGVFCEPAQRVIIEASNEDEANVRAESVAGLYFNGCASGKDCDCCGDRWYEQWKENGDPVPSIYGLPLTEIHNSETSDWGDVPFAIVYYADGRQDVMERKPAPTVVCAVCGRTEGAFPHSKPPKTDKTNYYHKFERREV